ncbi:MAG: hypothetical protein PF636_03855 [Actinomycetota bacterium]|jgi:hypothetical protein|nr:hypothetical protein [Actinomycetota bacterium]
MHHRTWKQIVVALVAMALMAGTLGPAPALASREAKRVRNQEQWPYDHMPESDPPARQRVVEPLEAQPEGYTDEQLAKADPEGYAALVPECRAIEQQLTDGIHQRLAEAGFDVGAQASTSGVSIASVLTAATYSPYAYLKFVLVPGTGSMTYNGYRGMLYFRYGYYSSYMDSYRWYTVSYPAISGNNVPRYQAAVNVGPIPEYTWDFGFIYGRYRGYESDYRTSFYPGKWRLDPWTGGPYGRGYLEVHGGTRDRYFKPTSGCIRLTPSAISSLRWYHTYRMANKYARGSAHLYVDY